MPLERRDLRVAPRAGKRAGVIRQWREYERTSTAVLNAYVDHNGEPVTGMADATVVPLDPTMGLAMLPGPLQGLTLGNGAAVGPDSIGMVEISLWSSSPSGRLDGDAHRWR